MSYSDQNYGEGDPNCTICGGLGYVRYEVPENHPHFGKIFPCECRQASVQSATMMRLRKLGGLQHLSDKTFASFRPEGVGQTTVEATNLRMAYDWALAFAQQPQGWIVFRGGYGCGKTHLAAAIANAQIEAGRSVLFMTVPDLLDYLKAAYSPSNNPEDSFDARLDQILNVPLLILDDMGTESPTAWALEKLYQIFNHRYMAQLPTVISTNKELDEFDPRIRSRLSDTMLSSIITITAPDYRQAGGRNITDLNVLGLYSNMTFENFQRDRALSKRELDNLLSAYNIARQFAQNSSTFLPQPGLEDDPEIAKTRQESTAWLILSGQHGSGKTHLAAAIANEQRTHGAGVLFVTVPDLLDHLRATYAPNSPVTFDKRLNEIKNARLLVLDDLGTEAATAWAKAKLFQLFDYRYVLRLPTVVTTTHNLEQIETLVDPGLVARMRDKRICRFFALLAPAYLGELQR